MGCSGSAQRPNAGPNSAALGVVIKPQTQQAIVAFTFGNKRKYIDIRSIVAFAATQDFVFVKASHFLALAAEPGGKFLRRQDLPDAAIADASTIEQWAAEVEHSVKLRAEYPAEEELQRGMRFPPFVIISYAWLNAMHPDPEGKQLREVLAPAIEWYMSERARYLSGDAYAVKHSSAKEGARLPAAFTAEGVDFGIFLDYSSIWQKERTEVQTASFGRALGSMDVLYAHQETVVWRLTRLLEGYEGTTPYNGRGWVSRCCSAPLNPSCMRALPPVSALHMLTSRARVP